MNKEDKIISRYIYKEDFWLIKEARDKAKNKIHDVEGMIGMYRAFINLYNDKKENRKKMIKYYKEIIDKCEARIRIFIFTGEIPDV